MADADLIFLPWVRRGATASLLPPDTFGAAQPGLASTQARLAVNEQDASVPVILMGPGNVIGLDPRQVVRTDPAPGSRSFEPNYFPLIELDEPSLPWLFTPASAGAQARLRPWLCLVVVRLQAGVRLDPAQLTPLPVLHISAPARLASELPDLVNSWAWAHAQVTAESGATDLAASLAANPERSVGRLLCPRALQPDTDYLACVVPTFDLGRKAGLGLDIAAQDEGRLTPAWDLTAPSVELPVYYSWTFATGAGGDFRSLALLLKARALPEGIGTKNIDVSQSGLSVAVPVGTTLPLAGALKPVGSSVGGWPSPALQTAWETGLGAVLNAPSAVTATEDPLLAPPLYGSAQVGLERLDTAHPARWFEQINLAPPYRAIAHLGTRVVQERQDELMASAWAQAADLARVNQLLRQTELGCRVALSNHTRHFARMDPGVGLQVLAPAQARMTRISSGSVLAARLHDTGLDAAAYSTALRRLARPRGAINRRVQRVGEASQPLPRTTSVLLRLQPSQVIARRRQPTSARISLEAVAASLVPPRSDISWSEGTVTAVAGAPPRPIFAFVPMGTPLPNQNVPVLPSHERPVPSTGPENATQLEPATLRPNQPPDPPDPTDPPLPPHPIPPRQVDSLAARLFRVVAEPQLARFNPPSVLRAPPPLRNGTLADAFAESLARTAPAQAYAARTRAVLTIPGPPRSDAAAMDPVGLSPVFPQPMVRSLTDVAQDLVLPGLDLVPPNTVVPLETNSEFVETYLVGLNTEMGRELLWRGYPANLFATYFDRFWDAASSPARPPDIDAIATWGDRGLGTTSADEDFVMLVRSELLRRYPDAVIHATRSGEDRYPIFTGGFAPDVRYVGFDIGVNEVKTWSIVIMEHPSAPRFGVDVGSNTGTLTHVAPAGTSSAQAAQHFRRMPVRITLPTSVLGLG